MEFKYLALGICVGYLAPYALSLIKAKKDLASQPNQDEIIDHDDQNNY
ncbi:MAG: hypothetical protein MRECE_2c147 [Mycoplasmataceae bacterium CE_OT135]|nr:MAG: hypothetical protein MRECE_2c147 [Mycoplasmataceae bacterium CE_OT135]